MESLNVMERSMSTLGLKTPPTRFVGVFVVTNAVVWFVKPKYFFEPKTGDERSDAIVPWWTLGLATGAIAALFL